ncbi:MAG TPA: CHAT domain-containing protein, partial [Kofleriaceae bacterium]
ELRLEAGQIHRAHGAAASLAPAGDALGRVRQALVRARIGLTAGRLRDAYDRIDELAAAPEGDPSLFASAAATRAAIFVELNLWRRAQEVATEAIRRLGSGPGVEPLVQLLARAKRDAGTRGRSVMAVWELPFEAPGVAARRQARPSVSLPGQAVGAPWRLASAWTSHANRVLEALEQNDLGAAATHQAALETATASVESDYIAARVRLSALLIAYCGAPSPATLEALCAVAQTLHELGARGAEAQATRYSAWAAAKLGRRDDYVGLARRSAAIIEEIARELPPVERGLYLTNKWNGRDELVAARLRELLDGGAAGPRTPSQRELCQVFREIDVLTHWAIDHAFGDRRAEALLDATSDEIVPWIRETLLALPTQRGGFRMRSPLSLWRLPARTLVLHYHVLPDRTYLFRIARGHIDMVPLPLGRVHLRTDMRALLDDPEALACLARDAGVAGALERFPGIRRLVIVPHDAMANLPFAALPVGGEPLCTQVAISQLDRLERLRRRRWFRRSGRCVSVGLSSYAGSDARDLPAAEDEAHAVAGLAGAGSILTGDAASCDGVLEALRGAARVHIAAHGSFRPDDPGQNGILLRDGGGYRTLSLHELRREPLKRLQLVTLATCRSAESALLPGGERICLPTALLDAGARGVIAALWPVDDTASVEVMTTLYRHLRTERPSVALARTQAELQDRPRQQWAGLVFYGND